MKAIRGILLVLLLLPLRFIIPETAGAPYALLCYDAGSDLTVTDARGRPLDFSYGPAFDGAGTLLLFPEKPKGLVTLWRNGLPAEKTAVHAAQLDFTEVYTYKLTGLESAYDASWQLFAEVNGAETLVYECRDESLNPGLYVPTVLCGPAQVLFRAIGENGAVRLEIPLDGETLLAADTFDPTRFESNEKIYNPLATGNEGNIYAGVLDVYSRAEGGSVLREKRPETPAEGRGAYELLATLDETFGPRPVFFDAQGNPPAVPAHLSGTARLCHQQLPLRAALCRKAGKPLLPGGLQEILARYRNPMAPPAGL